SRARLAEPVDRAAERAKVPDTLDPVSRSDREAQVEDWLDAHDLAEAWELAGSVVGLDLSLADLDELAERLPAAQLPMALRLVSQAHTAFALLEQITHGTQRISEIVTALKDYSYMDRAPVQ